VTGLGERRGSLAGGAQQRDDLGQGLDADVLDRHLQRDLAFARDHRGADLQLLSGAREGAGGAVPREDQLGRPGLGVHVLPVTVRGLDLQPLRQRQGEDLIRVQHRDLERHFIRAPLAAAADVEEDLAQRARPVPDHQACSDHGPRRELVRGGQLDVDRWAERVGAARQVMHRAGARQMPLGDALRQVASRLVVHLDLEAGVAAPGCFTSVRSRNSRRNFRFKINELVVGTVHMVIGTAHAAARR
jgi:hypothetical protein